MKDEGSKFTSTYHSASTNQFAQRVSLAQLRKRKSSMTSRGATSNGSGLEEKKVASAKEKSIQWGSRSVDIFEKIDQIGEGTYGYVTFMA